jgi:signal transduction histidine kinase
MASLGRVAAGIAHEIRNPLSGINIYLNALEKLYERGDLEKMNDVLAKIHSASSKIESVIKRVMDFSKPSEPKRTLIDIHKPIEDALGLSSVMLRKTGIKVDTMLMGGLPPCYIDPQLIEQVILNLITNAAQAMKDPVKEKKIEISTSRQDDSIRITVTDSGPGIPPSLRQKVFDPFYTTKSGSTGIGLSLSHRIIQDHKGRLSVSESKEGGAEFTILLPIQKK